MSIIYCKKCILPNTRPNINISSSTGICDACQYSHKKKYINWELREKKLITLINNIKSESYKYDCVIPVSGGKDSTWQVIKAINYGINPLCVTWKTPSRNSLGEKNLQNLINLGVNHIDFTINPKVEKIFTLKAFKRFGSPVIPMHMALHAIPLQIAVNFKIPLIVWGENSADEYGGEDNSLKGFRLNHNWLKRYGVTNGTLANDWVDEDLTMKDLMPYQWPSDSEQEKSGVNAIFLGYYLKWDPINTFKVAKDFGFTPDTKPKTGFYNFADIDDDFLITIHHWIKWYKFGFTRLWDNLALEIRNNRLSREDAIEIIKNKGDETPFKEIDKFCKYLDMSNSEFSEIVEGFRDKNIWFKNKNGKWEIKNFLIQNWEWI